jgi:hypothetical protein
MVAAEVGIEDAKQGMNGTEKDAKKSAREKVKDKEEKRKSTGKSGKDERSTETNTDPGDLDYIASPWPFFDRTGERGANELKETVKTEGRNGLKDRKSFR